MPRIYIRNCDQNSVKCKVREIIPVQRGGRGTKRGKVVKYSWHCVAHVEIHCVLRLEAYRGKCKGIEVYRYCGRYCERCCERCYERYCLR